MGRSDRTPGADPTSVAAGYERSDMRPGVVMGSALVLLLVLAAAPAFAQGNPTSDAVRKAWGSVKQNISESAEQMPEANYGFKPGSGSPVDQVNSSAPVEITFWHTQTGPRAHFRQGRAPSAAADNAYGPHALAPLRPGTWVGFALAAASSSGQRGRAIASRPSTIPAASRSAPAKAIIAALSVQ